MTVGVALGKSVATGTGSASAFPFNGPVAAVGELAVYTVVIATGVQALQTRGGSGTYDYSVSINSSTRYATVTLNNNLPDTHQVIILRDVDIKQETDYVAGDAFPAETHEAALDKLTFITTQLSEKIDRSIKFQEALASDTAGAITASSSNRASKALKFSSDGTSIGVSTYDPDASEAAAAASATAAAGSASTASTAATTATNYATKVDGAVTGTDYSAKAWSVGGTGVTDTSSRGSAKDWATKAEDSTVDSSEYSAKHYSIKASASATAAAGSASSASGASIAMAIALG